MLIREIKPEDAGEWSRMRTLLWPETPDEHRIDSEYQTQGFGKALMLKAEQWAKAKGYFELASDVELDNERSIAIHQHFGFEEMYRIVCFLKKLN